MERNSIRKILKMEEGAGRNNHKTMWKETVYALIVSKGLHMLQVGIWDISLCLQPPQNAQMRFCFKSVVHFTCFFYGISRVRQQCHYQHGPAELSVKWRNALPLDNPKPVAIFDHCTLQRWPVQPRNGFFKIQQI